MTDFRFRLIHITRCRGITRRWIRKLLLIDSTLTEIYKLSSAAMNRLYHLPLNNASMLYNDLHSEPLIEQIETDLHNYHVITLLDNNFSPLLKTIKDPPFVLYALGNISLLTQAPALSVIGTRKPSREAMGKVRTIIPPLVRQGWVIVSGMAIGIDRFAHEVTLSLSGHTIAVLGGGFQYIYPKENIRLYQELTKRGLVLSEYPPTTPPARHHFPERNRIISGLSFGTLVIEATEKSGTLITVDQALEQGRDVFAVPGSPLMEQTRGCHKMIQDGAKLVIHEEDIREEWERLQNTYG
ncbi:DNA-processing protein DprA [Virgibacillus salarius]|uniref:DNA-processing protein DprA n=1 Tax=Virgibacillus salarius TaxID=447199 RepID=UPI0031CFE996